MQTANNEIFFHLQIQMDKFLEREFGTESILRTWDPQISKNKQHIFLKLLIEKESVLPYPETEMLTVFFQIMGTLEESSFFIFKELPK
jgi:hypothetical protein